MNYLNESARTDLPDYKLITDRLNNEETARLIHAGLGLATEAAEFQDMLKKHIMYGKPIDKVNLAEEIGDTLWYCALALRTLGFSFEEIMDKNISKLKARFPDKFTEYHAQNRDLETERKILES